MSETSAQPVSMPPLSLMTLAAGGIDALGVLKLDEVFPSAMSGNTIFFGLALGQGRILTASHSMAAFAGYAAGVIAGSFFMRGRTAAIRRAVTIEVIPLIGFALLWVLAGGPENGQTMYGLIGLAAIAMGLQGAIARRLKVPGIMTIVITNTITTAMGTVADRMAGGTRPWFTPQVGRLGFVFLSYLVGAVAMGAMVKLEPWPIPYFSLTMIVLVAAGLWTRVMTLES